MESVLRSLAVYLFVLVVFRISGKRSLSQITTFDFILLLIIGEATQQALLGNDFSIINACVVIGTLITLDVALSWLEGRFPTFGRVVGSLPVVVARARKAAGRSREARRGDAFRDSRGRTRKARPRAARAVQVRDPGAAWRHQRGAHGRRTLTDPWQGQLRSFHSLSVISRASRRENR